CSQWVSDAAQCAWHLVQQVGNPAWRLIPQNLFHAQPGGGSLLGSSAVTESLVVFLLRRFN
ncbi:hypothetical protein, partial [Shewanella sp.]|uniref:hypothetical protein n=1 Tax=Shewanella sp. TaxID=50422 RepID=UPI001B47E0E9